MPDSSINTNCATMFVRTLQHIPNRRVFHTSCDFAVFYMMGKGSDRYAAAHGVKLLYAEQKG